MKTEHQKIHFPFSDRLIEVWQIWKQFKKEQFRFTYKGVISEQAALNNLVELSQGNEETAEKIIMQSINNGWRGIFPLKQNQKTNEPTARQSEFKQATGFSHDNPFIKEFIENKQRQGMDGHN